MEEELEDEHKNICTGWRRRVIRSVEGEKKQEVCKADEDLCKNETLIGHCGLDVRKTSWSRRIMVGRVLMALIVVRELGLLSVLCLCTYLA